MRIRTVLTRDRDLGDSQTMTPMIDIVFLMLVFFVCVATDQVVELTLPTELHVGGVESPAAEPQEAWVTEIRLTVTHPPNAPAALIEMNGRSFSDYNLFRQTLDSLAEISRDSPIILDVSDNVELGDMLKIYDACRAAQFPSINFAMKKSELKTAR